MWSKNHYGMAILLLIDVSEVQSWTCDGAQVACSLESLQNFLDKLNEHGDLFGLFVMNKHLFTNRKFFKRPTNWNFLELDDDVLKLNLFWVYLLVFDKKCKNFMKNNLTNYSNTLKKLAKHRSVSLRMCTNHLQIDCNTSWLLLPEYQFASKKLARVLSLNF